MGALAVIPPLLQRVALAGYYVFSRCDHPSHGKYLPFAAEEGHYHYKALSSGLLQLRDICLTVEND